MAPTHTENIPLIKQELSEKGARGNVNIIMGIILLAVIFHHYSLRTPDWKSSPLEVVLAAGDTLFIAGAALFIVDGVKSYLRVLQLFVKIELLSEE